MNDVMRLNYLKHRNKWHTICNMTDTPILILLWWLGYYTGFWWLLGLIILGELGYGVWMTKQEKKLGLR